MTLPMPQKVPSLGLYYHYKHDPSGPINNYAYEVVGVGFHTEEDCRPGEEHFVIYRPLYDASVAQAQKRLCMPCFDTRPLGEWMGEVEKDGQKIPRFRKIEDQAVIEKLFDKHGRNFDSMYIETILKYRLTIRRMLLKAGVPSSSTVTDDWLLEQLAALIAKK